MNPIPDCTPPAVNGDSLRVAPSEKPGPGACSRSNLDSTLLRVVRKGDRVALVGFHFRVKRVRLGWAYIAALDAFGRERGRTAAYQCSVLQVVA